MRGRSCAGVVTVVACGVVWAGGPAPADAGKADALAKAAVVTYLKAFQAEDVDAVMAVVAVPFVMNDRGTVGTEAALRAEFARVFARSDLGTMTFEVKAAGALADVRGKLAEKRHEAKLKAALGGDGRVVLADAVLRKDRTESMAFAVRVRDGKARVVAMFD